MSIQPFNSANNPLRGVTEDPTKLLSYVQHNALLPLMQPLWKAASFNVRQAMLEHLWNQAWAGDMPRSGFYEVRELDMEGFDKAKFVKLALLEDFDGEGPMCLHVYVSLYIETRQGVSKSHFNTEAFYRNYREALGLKKAA